MRTAGSLHNPIGAAGISLIDARDVGECAAEALIDPRWDGTTLALTGPRAVTYHQIAALLETRTGRAVPVRDITPDDIRVSLEQRGMPGWEAEHFQEMYQLFRDGWSGFVTNDVQRMLGRPPATVEHHLATLLGLLTARSPG